MRQRASHWTVTRAFGFFGTVPVNIAWSWSARSPDGNTVAINWWRDEIGRDSSGKLVFDTRNCDPLHVWRDRLGNRQRIRDLAWARDNCNGLFRVVWCKVSNPAPTVRKVVERHPDANLRMRLKELNESTGEFYAVHE